MHEKSLPLCGRLVFTKGEDINVFVCDYTTEPFIITVTAEVVRVFTLIKDSKPFSYESLRIMLLTEYTYASCMHKSINFEIKNLENEQILALECFKKILIKSSIY